MMQFTIITVGHKMPRWIDEGFQTYIKRLSGNWKIILKAIKPIARVHHTNTLSIKKAMALERISIEAAIPKKSKVVVLDEHGTVLTSQQFADQLLMWQMQGQPIVFVIGGAQGIDLGLTDSAHERIRLSSFTLPHGLARVLLAEQLYRAYAIIHRHPYHRAGERA